MKSKHELVLVSEANIPTVSLVHRVYQGTDRWASVSVSAGAEFLESFRFADCLLPPDLLLIRIASIEATGLVTRLQQTGTPYAYLIDDNFWLLLGDDPLHQFYRHPAVRSMLESVLQGAKVVLCHSEYFRNFLLQFNANVQIVKPFFDFACLLGLRAEPLKEFRIGIVANPSRANDVAFLIAVVIEVLRRSDTPVYFEFFGYTPPELRGRPGVRSLEPIADYGSFIAAQFHRNWSLALAPLIHSRFAEYKTNNKFREFGACQIAGIYSDVPIYAESVANEVTGWVVPNESELWVSKILWATEHRDAVAQVGLNARRHIESEYSLDHVRSHWVTSLETLNTSWVQDARRIIKTLALAVRARTWPQRQISIHSDTDENFSVRNSRVLISGAGYIFVLKPGESISSTRRALVSGDSSWGFRIGTYGNVADRLDLTISSGESGLERTIFLENVADGDCPNYIVHIEEGGHVTFSLVNNSSTNVALYALSRLGTTRYKSAAKSFKLSFIA